MKKRRASGRGTSEKLDGLFCKLLYKFFDQGKKQLTPAKFFGKKNITILGLDEIQ